MKREKIRHPAHSCTHAQKRAFELIAVCRDSEVNPRTADVLVKRGLVEEHEEIVGGGIPVRIKRYSVPFNIHYQWRRWCAENVEEPAE